MSAANDLEEYGVIISRGGRFELCSAAAGLWKVRISQALANRQPQLMTEYDSFQDALRKAVDEALR